MDFIGIGAGIAVFLFSFLPFERWGVCVFGVCGDYAWRMAWSVFPMWILGFVGLGAAALILFKMKGFALAAFAFAALLILAGIFFSLIGSYRNPTFGAVLLVIAAGVGIWATLGGLSELKKTANIK